MHMPLFVFRENHFSSLASNWFIVADSHHPIIKLTRDLLFAYWKDHNHLMHYFIFHMFFKMAAEAYNDIWAHVPFVSNRMPHEMQFSMYQDYSDDKMKYFASISDFHKLTYHKKDIPSSSILQHILESYEY